MNKTLKWMWMLTASVALLGCAGLPPERQPLKLDEVQALGKQKQATDTLLEQIDQRGLGFDWTPENAAQLKNGGVTEPVMRYLQGRAAGERAANRVESFRDPYCSGAFYPPGFLYPYPVRYIYLREPR